MERVNGRMLLLIRNALKGCMAESTWHYWQPSHCNSQNIKEQQLVITWKMAEAIAVEVVKGFVTDSAKSLLSWVIARIGEEIALAWGFEDDLRDLQQRLKRVEGLLFGATSSPNLILNDWLKKVKAVTYEARDVLDEYAYELLKRRVALQKNNQQRCQQPDERSRFNTKLRLFMSPSSNPVVFRLQMAHRVKALKESIDHVYADAKGLGIKPVKVAAGAYHATHSPSNAVTIAAEQLQWRREEAEYEWMIGRDDDIHEIVDLICHYSNNNKLLNVIGVYGMAGLGKTALC